MLSDEALESRFFQFGIPEEGRKRIRWIRANAPIRRTEGGKRSVKVRYVSRKMGFVIEAEASQTEYAAIRTFDYDDVTHEIYSQPTVLQISYVSGSGRKVTCQITPDLFLIRTDGFQLIECKPEQTLQKLAIRDPNRYQRAADGAWRSPPAEEAARALGCQFKIRSTTENDPILINNLELLEDYIDAQNAFVPFEAHKVVLDILERDRWATARSLIDALADYGADAFYHMIARGEAYFDLSSHRLSRPDTALIFRDEEAARVYGIYAAAMAGDQGWRNPALRLNPGSQFNWDGCRWEILNVGQTKLHARQLDAQGASPAFIDLDQDQLISLTRSGAISAVQLPESTEGGNAEARELMRRCSNEQIRVATLRYQILFNELPHDFSARSVKAWRARYRAAEIKYGNGLLGLVPDLHRRRGNHTRRIIPDVLEHIQELGKQWATPHQPTFTALYGKLVVFCRELGVDVPSKKTVTKEIRRLSNPQAMKKRYGSRVMYVEEVPFLELEYTTPRHGDRPFHIGHIDHTPIDLTLVDRSAAAIKKSAWLTFFLDAYSRSILAWYLTFDPPSYRSCMMVVRDCIRRHGRLPQFVVVDQGSDFRSEYFEKLLANFRCNKKERPTARSHFGSVIERLFRTTQQDFVYNLKGNKQAHRYHRQLTKAVDPVQLAVWNVGEFEEQLESYIVDVYHKTDHATLGTTPENAFKSGLAEFGLREHTWIPFDRDVIALTCPSTPKGTARVSPQGVKIRYDYFSCPELADRRLFGTSVPVRYDPFDCGHAYAYVEGAWHECFSRHYAIFQGYSERAMRLATLQYNLSARQHGPKAIAKAERLAEFLLTLEPNEDLMQQRRLDAESARSRDKLATPTPQSTSVPVPLPDIGPKEIPNQKRRTPKILEVF
jgi:putative transposase